MTHIFNREDIENVLPSLPWKDRVRFIYLGRPIPWHENRLIARLQDWAEIRRWTKQAGFKAKELVLKERFDAGYHSTIATWRIPSPLAGLGLPWIWGPIGGGVDFPRRFLPILSPTARAFELLRISANAIGKMSHSLKKCARDASIIFVNTPETRQVIRRLGANESLIKDLSQTFLSDNRLLALYPKNKKWAVQGEEINIVAGGTLEGLKGVSLALQALARCKAKGLKFRYRYLGQGSEMDHLRRLADKLGIGDVVQFGEWLQGADFIHALQQAHLYLLPSLREGVPVTLVEAMAAGCVPIVANCGGPALVVDDASGIRVMVSNPQKMITSLTEAVMDLSSDPEKLAIMSREGIRRINEHFSKGKYLSSLNTALEKVATKKT
jgi:glycosyltransferase involved in cell wall biosynthesis